MGETPSPLFLGYRPSAENGENSAGQPNGLGRDYLLMGSPPPHPSWRDVSFSGKAFDYRPLSEMT